MNNPDQLGKTRIRVGIFVILGLLLIGSVTVWVNHKPYWWRPCQLVQINVDDATGLKTKSPIRSLGLEIGYLNSVQLSETHVTLGICITAAVEILPATRAYIRGEGFLGDKFVELKPVRYVGKGAEEAAPGSSPTETSSPSNPVSPTSNQQGKLRQIPFAGSVAWQLIEGAWDGLIPSADAADPATPPAKPTPDKGRVVPVGAESEDMQQLVGRVDKLVRELTGLTTNLKESINPQELHETLRQLNHALENAGKTLSPQGGLNQTAQRTLEKLEDAIDQIRDQFTRINQGQGSLGKLLNDPSYAEEIHEVLRSANKLLSKVNDVRFVLDIGAVEVTNYNSGRGYLTLQIFPTPTYYYLLGVSNDPRGRIDQETDTITAGGTTTTVQVNKVDQTGILFTAMVGKIFTRYFEGAVGVLYGDGDVTARLRLGPAGYEDRLVLQDDIYSHSQTGIDSRMTLIVKPFPVLYVKGGLEGFRAVNGGSAPLFIGGGVQFDDENIKLLFALR